MALEVEIADTDLSESHAEPTTRPAYDCLCGPS